ncbi:hypothetical protein ABZ746_31995 [Streptomyces sp. NPDC020096]
MSNHIVLTREQFYLLRAEMEEHDRQAKADEITLDSNGVPDCAPHCPRCQQRAGAISAADGRRFEFLIGFQPCGHEFALPPGERL